MSEFFKGKKLFGVCGTSAMRLEIVRIILKARGSIVLTVNKKDNY